MDDGGKPLSESRERARKIRPQYAQGPLVRVATARNQAEAELIEGLLLEEGIPSLVRRTGGFDVPDFLASGPRELLVPAAGAELARELLGTPEPVMPAAEGTPAWVKALAVAVAVGIVALIAAGVFAAVFP
jgi:Putative prokaryotic signal transducing protein